MSTKLCNFCGKEIPDTSKICPYCNKALNNKVFSYMNENQTSSNSNHLDVSKYLKTEEPTAQNYFNTNIYSYSQSEIEKRFEKKALVYDEDERKTQNEQYINQRDAVPARTERHKKKSNQNAKFIAAIAGIIIVILIIVIIANAISKPSKTEDIKNSTTATTATTAQTTAETSVTIPTAATSAYKTLGSSSTDMYGYINVDFSNVESDFNDPNGEPVSNNYGGSDRIYDGMTVSTDSNGKICAIIIDFASANNKEAYKFKYSSKELNVYSTYEQIISDFGEPATDDIGNALTPSISYIFDVHNVKIIFDENKAIKSLEITKSQSN